MHHLLRQPSTTLLALVLVVLAVGAIDPPPGLATPTPTKPAPRLGLWKGTATDAAGTHAVSFRVVKRSGRYEIRRLRVALQESCAAPGPPDPAGSTEFENAVLVDRVRIRTNGRFRISDAEAGGSGRFLSSRRMKGSASGAPVGLTCSGTLGTFTATAVAR